MVDPHETDIAPVLDTQPMPDADGLPADVREIFASLDEAGEEPVETVLDADEAISQPTSEPLSDAPAEEVGWTASEESSSDEAEDEAAGMSQDEAGEAPETATLEVTAADASVEGVVAADGPPAVATEVAGETVVVSPVNVPAWPFVAYLLVWVAVNGVAAWMLLSSEDGVPAFATDLYQRWVVAGLALTAAGPCLIFAVWLATRLRAGDRPRTGLFTRTLLWGSLATFGGVVMWCGTLVVVDILRLGRWF